MKLRLKTLVGLFMFFFWSCVLYAQKEEVQLPEIAKEIKKMRDEDQKNRTKWAKMINSGKSETEKFKAFTSELIALDRANTARMREIINEFGWPTYDLVGQGPSNSAWLIVQHADRNPLFQARCLPLLKAAVDAGQANPSNYAYLYDRVQVSKGEMQRYATQSSSNNGLYKGAFFPIEDESNVQVRREEMKITQHVEAYAAAMGFEYVVPSKEDAQKKSAELQEQYQRSVSTAEPLMKQGKYSEAASHYLTAVAAFGHATTENFVQTARALSLSEHEQSGLATAYLLKAIVRGWNGFDPNNPDYNYLKQDSPGRWEDFLKTVDEMAIDL